LKAMRERGDIYWFFANIRRSDLALHRRVMRTIANLARRVPTPPHDCCGRPGEPGC